MICPKDDLIFPKYDLIFPKYDLIFPKYDRISPKYGLTFPYYDWIGSQYDWIRPQYDWICLINSCKLPLRGLALTALLCLLSESIFTESAHMPIQSINSNFNLVNRATKIGSFSERYISQGTYS